MTTVVHVTYHTGLTQLPVVSAKQAFSNGILAVSEPALSEVTASIESSASELAAAPSKTKVARVQVEDGGKLRYKVVNESNAGQSANSSSPAIVGEQLIPMDEGWVLSLIEA